MLDHGERRCDVVVGDGDGLVVTRCESDVSAGVTITRESGSVTAWTTGFTHRVAAGIQRVRGARGLFARIAFHYSRTV